MISPKNKTTTKDANNNRSANKKKQHQISAKRTKNLKQQIVPMKNNVLSSGTATNKMIFFYDIFMMENISSIFYGLFQQL